MRIFEENSPSKGIILFNSSFVGSEWESLRVIDNKLVWTLSTGNSFRKRREKKFQTKEIKKIKDESGEQ